MGKKDKKKGKPQPGDWSDDEPKASAAAPAQNGAGSDEEDEPQQKSAASRFNFSSFVDDGAGDDDEDDDGGGLMAAIRSSESRKKLKKDKKKAKTATLDDDEAGEGGEAAADDAVDLASKAPTEMTADQLMDEEFGPSKSKAKGKKGKKGKNQPQPGIDDDDFLDQQIKNLSLQNADSAAKSEPEPAKPQADAPQAVADEGEDAGDDGEPRLLSKKEKERLKKEKEKAKKKAQAAAKKASGTVQAPEAAEEAAASPTVEMSQATAADEAADDAEEGEGAGETAASKNKKKKKKGAAAKQEEAAAAAAAKPAAGRKVPAHIAALQAAMAKQKAAEEEARKREEEERKRIEDEEARQAELERQKEEEKKRKKEKEKAKKEQLKKEGKYLTPKQKADAAAAAARREAMIASGQIKVDGLTSPTEAETTVPKTKKPTYGKKKPQAKKAGSGGLEVPAIITATPTEPQETIQEDPTREAEHEPEAAQAATVNSTAPAAGDESKALADADAEDDLDDWDADSASEKEEDKKSEPVAKASRAVDQKQKATASKDKVQENGSAKPSPAHKVTPSKPAPSSAAPMKQTDKATKAPVKTQAQAEESEDSGSEEDDEEEEDDDDDDDEDDDDDDEESSEEDSDSDSDSKDSEEERISTAKKAAAQRKAEAAARREQKRQEAIAAGSKDDLRSPICCILGHVDTGKTKLLDKIRQSNVQEGEAGGITQQIGATYFPTEAIKSKTAVLGDADIKEYKLPGLLVIDTPGHESFTNLRTRGSSLCNIAILVVDIMHGLEPQTLESIRLLRTGKTPFIVALNKIDRLYGWEATPNGAFRESLAKQSRAVQAEFQKRLTEALLAFSEQGLNAVPYYENTNFAKYVSVVPTSAHTGEGIADMLMLITKLTQERMSGQLMYITELECTVLEVKVIEGLGTTLDVVLVNGVLNEGDKIVVCGLNGPIVTQIRALLTPQPMKELRIRGQYVHHQQIKAAMGIKIVAPELEKAIAGSRLLVCGEDDDEDELREAVMADLQSLVSSVDKSGRGVYVQASTLGSLEALLEFLKQSKIPVSNINIGPVHKKDVTRCAAMLDRSPELAVILAFDVPVDKEAERLAEENNIKIFKADIIYHLFDDFTKHNQAILEAKRKDAAPTAVWPCRLKVLKCFAKRDPIILGCDIIEGSSLRVGTPLCVVKVDPETKQKTIIKLGKVSSLEINHKAMEVVKKTQVGAGVAVKIEHAVYESAKLFGRHFNEHDELISLVSRASIDALKTHFREQVDKDDWTLIAKKLKPLLDVA